MSITPQYFAAIQDFRKLRRRVAMQRILGLVTKPSGLWSYQSVRQQLHAIEKPNTQLREIPIHAIKGSVGRYEDFTRDFLPKDSIDEQRWARVKTQFLSPEGIPPIEVYQVGEVYFVLDGNHRVSVARQMEIKSIEAYVKEVKTKVPLKLDENIDQLLIKTELTEFLEQTQFNLLYPDENLTVTAPGRYTIILQQIEAIHFALEFDKKEPVLYEQAVKRWYDNVYYPIIGIIRDQKIMQDYPERTETDLFLWIFKHRAKLVETLEWEITTDQAIKDFTQLPGSRGLNLRGKIHILSKKIIQKIHTPRNPLPGSWRNEKLAAGQGRLFGNLLAVIDGTQPGWQVLSLALTVANFEGSQVFGLHISPDLDLVSPEQNRHIREEFERRCQQKKITGQIAFEVGSPKEIIRDRTNWVDLVILPGIGPIGDEIHPLARVCPIPIMIVKENLPPINRILLVYDGSPKSDEALFLSAYLSTFWELSVSILSIVDCENAQISSDTISRAKEFFDQYGVRANYIEWDSDPVSGILTTAQEYDSDLILFGDYCQHSRSRSHITTLDIILDNTQLPLLICQQ